jgi:hypothetical protein
VIEAATGFLRQWGQQAETLGWTSGVLFGFHTPPANPAPSYSRLSRYDETGLLWFLHSGRTVVALTRDTATIRYPSGNTLVYRKKGIL